MKAISPTQAASFAARRHFLQSFRNRSRTSGRIRFASFFVTAGVAALLTPLAGLWAFGACAGAGIGLDWRNRRTPASVAALRGAMIGGFVFGYPVFAEWRALDNESFPQTQVAAAIAETCLPDLVHGTRFGVTQTGQQKSYDVVLSAVSSAAGALPYSRHMQIRARPTAHYADPLTGAAKTQSLAAFDVDLPPQGSLSSCTPRRDLAL